MTENQIKIQRAIGVAVLVNLQATAPQFLSMKDINQQIKRLLDDSGCECQESWLIRVYNDFAAEMHARGAWYG